MTKPIHFQNHAPSRKRVSNQPETGSFHHINGVFAADMMVLDGFSRVGGLQELALKARRSPGIIEDIKGVAGCPLFAGYFGLNDDGLMQRYFEASSRREDRSQVNTHSMMSPRLARSVLGEAGVRGSLGAGVVVLSGFSGAASAQARLDARYEATLAGIPVGKGAWTIEIADDQFSAAASGGTAGLLKAFSGGSGTSASQGRVVNGALVPQAYVATTTASKKSESIRMALVNGYVKEFAI